jgi:tRNA A-37 threonylcarbamoyl transferase component Bud32
VQPLEHDQFLALRDGAEVIEADHFGDKVLRRPDGTYLKLFRRKRLLSSAAWYPYAQRFADNARKLAVLGIPCPEVLQVYRLPAIGRDVVHYRPLPGRTLRQIIAQAPDAARQEALRRQVGAFVAQLHALGVYFRSLHLGNVVLTPDDRLGLIDLADLTTRNRPLGSLRRQRNLRHVMRYADDAAWLNVGDAFTRGYECR